MASTHQNNLDPEFNRLNIVNFAPKQYSPNMGKKVMPVVPPKPKKIGNFSSTTSSTISGSNGSDGLPSYHACQSIMVTPPSSTNSSSSSSSISEASYEPNSEPAMTTLVSLERPNLLKSRNRAFATVLQPNIDVDRFSETSSKNGTGARTYKTVVDIPSLNNGQQKQQPPQPLSNNYRTTQQPFNSHVSPATVTPAKPPSIGTEGVNAGYMSGGGSNGGAPSLQPTQQMPQHSLLSQHAQTPQGQPPQPQDSNYCNPSNYSNSSNYSNASNYSNMANYSGSSNYSNSSNYSDFSNYDHYNALGSLTSYGGSYTPPPPEDELPPPPPPEPSYTPSTNHNFPPPPPPAEEFPPPPSPVSSSYSELRRAGNPQNYSTYGPISSQSSTYESIYEPILPRPSSQMSNRSAYSTGSSLYGGYPNPSRNKPSVSLSNMNSSQGRSGDHHPGKEDEVDVLTNLLVRSMENSGDPDFFGICSKCGEKVTGEGGCTAMELVYHIKCFTCFVCQSPLQGKPFYALDTKPYCEEDYLNTLEKCSVCTKPILDRILRATGKPYHPKCFTCVVCGKCLDGIPFTVDATNQIHCIEDFHKKFAPRCCVCKQPIMPELGQQETVRVVALDKSFHVSCYKCEDCGLVLSSEAEGRGCYPLDDHILCKSCNAKRVQFLTSRMATEL